MTQSEQELFTALEQLLDAATDGDLHSGGFNNPIYRAAEALKRARERGISTDGCYECRHMHNTICGCKCH